MDNDSLIPYNGIPPELVEVQKKKQEESLTNLITGITPKDFIFQREAGKRRDGSPVYVDYVPGWWFIGQLNALFGYFWDFEISEHGIGEYSCWVKGKLTVRSATTGLTVTKTAFGGSKLKSKDNPAIDIGDDLKSAATDALKKAATLLGLAADVYGRREVKEETSGKARLNSLYKLAEKKGMSEEEVALLSKKEFKEPPELLTESDILTLMGKVREVSSKGES